jgi:hypothetical protein
MCSYNMGSPFLSIVSPAMKWMDPLAGLCGGLVSSFRSQVYTHTQIYRCIRCWWVVGRGGGTIINCVSQSSSPPMGCGRNLSTCSRWALFWPLDLFWFFSTRPVNCSLKYFSLFARRGGRDIEYRNGLSLFGLSIVFTISMGGGWKPL